MKYLDYKGYTGTIEYSAEDELLFGKVVGIKGLLSYEGTTGTELEANFKSTIDDYLADCKADGVTPDKPFKGSFNVRIAAELHRSLALAAMQLGTSQSLLVGESIKSYLATVYPELATVVSPKKSRKANPEKQVPATKRRVKESTKAVNK